MEVRGRLDFGRLAEFGSDGTTRTATRIRHERNWRSSSMARVCAMVCVPRFGEKVGVCSEMDILVVHPLPREGDVREGHLGTGSAEGLQPQERDWNRRDWNLNCKLVKCTGALHSSFPPNLADSCSVELTEGWCQVAYLERGAALFPRRDPQFTLRGTKVVRC